MTTWMDLAVTGTIVAVATAWLARRALRTWRAARRPAGPGCGDGCGCGPGAGH